MGNVRTKKYYLAENPIAQTYRLYDVQLNNAVALDDKQYEMIEDIMLDYKHYESISYAFWFIVVVIAVMFFFLGWLWHG